MKTFLKVFFVILLIQLIFIAQMLFTGMGDGVVYFVYGLPFMLLESVIKLPKQAGDENSIFPLIALCMPSVLYAIVIAAIWTMFSKGSREK